MENQTYPKQTEDGYFFESAEHEAISLETKIHENSRPVHRVKLSDGRVAVIRKLKGKDVELTNRIHQGDDKLVIPSIIAVATTIDGENKVMEDFLEMDAPDYNKIRQANLRLNF